MNWGPSLNGVMLRSCWAVHSAVGTRVTEKPKSLAVPPKYGVGLHEHQGVSPTRQKARQQNYETTLTGLEDLTFDLSRCDDELLAKQRIPH